ncbi:MAG: LysR family transcriptional regulator [Desulfohalobiaceae bacterium]|nr:LysR family transcriptional regulator [Desulfohalobiaceae bacterium]
MLNFNLLRVFYEVARTSSVTKAANRLFITQPAVSNALKKLNVSLGIKLLKKTSQGMILTSRGAVLFEYLKQIFDIEKEIETFLEVGENTVGSVSVGLSTLYARYLISELTKAFHIIFPGINIRYYSGSSQTILRKLVDFQVEIAIAARYIDNPNIAYFPFRKDKLVLLTSNKHDFAKRGIIHFEELEGERLIMKESGSATGETVKAALEKRKMVPEIIAELVNLDVILEMVEDNQGVAFLPALIMNHLHKDKNFTVVHIEDEILFFDSYLAVLKNEKLSPAAKGLLEMLRTYGESAI